MRRTRYTVYIMRASLRTARMTCRDTSSTRTASRLTKQLKSLRLGGSQSSSLLYENGNLFTGGGEVWTPDTQAFQGSFAVTQGWSSRNGINNGLAFFSAIPVPLSDRNQVVFVYKSVYSTTGSVTLFDTATRRPRATLPITSSSQTGPSIAGAVRAGDTIAILVDGQIMLVPINSLQQWPQSSPTLQSVSPGVQRIDFQVNAISSLPGSSNLAFATPSTDGDLGNSLVIFNPTTGQVESSVFVGSEPMVLAPTLDGSSIYTSLAGERRVARVDLAAGARDLLFTADPSGGSAQFDIFDMVVGPDGGLAVSYPATPGLPVPYAGAAIAVFDNAGVRPEVAWNTQGPSQYLPATFKLAFDSSGSKLYAQNTYLSPSTTNRMTVTPAGVRWLSGVNGLLAGEIRSVQGLVYGSTGNVVDPERSRLVGRFAYPGIAATLDHVCVDLAAGRVYFSYVNAAESDVGIAVFDSNTHSMLGRASITRDLNISVQTLVRYGDGGLAFLTSDVRTNATRVWLMQTAAIPMLDTPSPTAQPPALPITPGVTVVDLAAADIAYDATRNLLYSTVPNSEGALGDRIAVIDPSNGRIVTSYPTDLEPRLLALPSDNSRLYYTSGGSIYQFYDGLWYRTESVRSIDLASGISGSPFWPLPPGSAPGPLGVNAPVVGYSSGIYGLAVLNEAPQSVAILNSFSTTVSLPDGSTPTVGFGQQARLFDAGKQRPNTVDVSGDGSYCTSIQSGTTASRLYCWSRGRLSKFGVDGKGITLDASTAMSQGSGFFDGMIFSGGRIYTETGLVIDAETSSVIATVPAQGPAAVVGNRVYWLDPAGSSPASPTVNLRSYDALTFQAINTKEIRVTATDVTRLVSCGEGRLAFRAGHEVYIVQP